MAKTVKLSYQMKIILCLLYHHINDTNMKYSYYHDISWEVAKRLPVKREGQRWVSLESLLAKARSYGGDISKIMEDRLSGFYFRQKEFLSGSHSASFSRQIRSLRDRGLIRACPVEERELNGKFDGLKASVSVNGYDSNGKRTIRLYLTEEGEKEAKMWYEILGIPPIMVQEPKYGNLTEEDVIHGAMMLKDALEKAEKPIEDGIEKWLAGFGDQKEELKNLLRSKGILS